jgi:lipoprotein-releasing system permease protein
MYELFVAWRHLHTRWTPAKLWVLLAGGGLLIAAGLVFWRAAMLGPPVSDAAARTLMTWNIVGMALAITGWLTLMFAIFYQKMSIFTTISTFGVYLGTHALVIALSVMNGFQADLREKILGSNAHLLISKEEGAFTEYREIGKSLEGVCDPGTASCVVAWTPYLTSEIVVAANQNYGSTVIKGIDPVRAAAATDLPKSLGDRRGLERLWPQSPEGKPIPYAPGDTLPTPVDGDGDEPPVFDGDGEGGDDEEPEDFSGGASLDAGVPSQPSVPGEPRPLSSDPRLLSLDGVLVGRELAKNLHLYSGQEVQVVSPLGKETPAGQIPRTKPFRVAGTFFTGMFEYDTKLVYVSLPALQSFLSLGDEVHGLEVRVTDMDRTPGLVRAIGQKLGKGYRVQGWEELNKSLFAALKLEKIAMFLVLSIIILVASFSIVSNLIMVVVEKGRDVAVLKSLGAADLGVMRIFVFRGLYIGVIGTLTGVTLGVISAVLMTTNAVPLDPNVYYIDRVPVALDPVAVVFVAIAGVVISAIATIYPAYTSVKLRPTDGLRKG